MPGPRDFLAAETRSLLTRVDRLKPFVLQETMLPAAVLLPRALIGIEDLLRAERVKLHELGRAYLRWLAGAGREAPAGEAQRRFGTLRVRLNEHLSQLDMFAEAISQRSESEIGVWLSGMDVAASDALRLNRSFGVEEVPIICYLARGPGAAIRRARTRLPGDVPNPVAIVRMPRERMVGHGIASSLCHEVGHQGSALLGLIGSVRAEIAGRARQAYPADDLAWHCWNTWISEIIADFWSVAKLGIGSTVGLMGVVSLPRPFVFRFNLEDPHPFPWIRVLLSAAIGDRLYPSPQWRDLVGMWQRLYPVSETSSRVAAVIHQLTPTIPELADLLAGHTPASLGGATLADALAHPSRNPEPLRRLFTQVSKQPAFGDRLRPALRFAMLGQARWDSRLSADDESRVVDRMLTDWAAAATLQMATANANQQLITTSYEKEAS